MAYTHPGIHRIGPTNSDVPTLWSYSTSDNQATINTSGYFNDAADDLTVGDVIFAHIGSGAVVLFPVLSNASSVVDVADGTVLAVTDTD